ncbi:MAG TPA: peptidoglycan-binding domain-containing protein [Polyangia bacterium]|jgi:N-acetylmuramoyl-L-alanine amidase
MPTDHVTQPGECIASISSAYKLPWEKIWNHPKNAELKQRRKDPNVIREGDTVYVPDPEQRKFSLATGAVHQFVVKRLTVRLRLRVVVDFGPKPPPPLPPKPPSPDRRNIVEEDPEPDATPRTDEARKGLAFKLVIDGVTIEGQTDGDGYLDCQIPAQAMSGHLVLAPGTPHETEVPLHLGHLDPIAEVSGIKQRLRNLCFDCGDQTDDETPGLAAALRAFQAKHGLSVNGEIDDPTRAEILKAHGT